MFDFKKFTTDVLSYKNQEDLSKYLESCYIELEEYFEGLSLYHIDKIKFDIEDFLLDMLDAELIQKENNKMINAFLLLFAQKLEQTNLIGAITLILNYLPDSAIKNRLNASRLYLKVNNISKDYFTNFEKIVELISSVNYEEEYKHRKVNAILNFIKVAMESFTRVNNSKLANDFKKLFYENREKYEILNDSLISEVIEKSSIENLYEKINNNTLTKVSCEIKSDSIIQKEDSQYSKKLYAMTNPTFIQVRQLAYEYIKSIGDPDELYINLERGEAIIEDENLLYKYLVSFGEKHKEKLYSAFEAIIAKLNGEKLNIIDWGCGQAFATMMLLEFAKERGIELNISNIYLIEPSKIALSRGLLHVDVFNSQDCDIKAINSDIDCLKNEDILFDNNNKTLHLLSNILDVESFRLDKTFLKKISTNIKSDNLFVCVSPNINDKRNSRIDLFYKYFDDNFNTELLSARDTDIDHHKRYEKIFEVKYTKQEEVIKSRKEIQEKSSSYHSVYDDLKSYKEHIATILDLDKLDESIDKDPEYLIFKTRKAAEVITSKIYSKYESNSKNVSFNDMIRYLSFEKGLFNKKITSNLHTIRTIGNINVHEHDLKIDEQKLDAHLMLISLLILLKELENKKLF